MNKGVKTIFILVAFLLALSTHSLAGQFKVTRVYDGDTIKVEGYNIVIYVLLAGIDAPEIASRNQQQPYGQEAKRYLEKLVLNKVIDIIGYGLGPSPYDRIIGEVHLKDKNINMEMVKEGFAEVWHERPPDSLDIALYLEVQREAKAAMRGMWSLGEKYISPRDWREMCKRR